MLWPYTNKDTNERILTWATGRRRPRRGRSHGKCAHGQALDKREADARARRSCCCLLVRCTVLWEWDADPEFDEPAGAQWLMLLPKKWNPRKQGGRSTVGASTPLSLAAHARRRSAREPPAARRARR